MSMGFFDVIPTDDVTLHGLEKWTVHLYENLGWMTLAYDNKREDKVISYITSIKKLKLSIENRMEIITSEDAKLDLVSLLSKVKHLTTITTKLFDKESLKKSICDKCSSPISNHNDIKGGGSKTKKNTRITNTKSPITTNIKKTSKTQSKKSSKKNSKTNVQNEPLIKKLSKKSSKKTSKKTSKKSLKKTL